MKAVAATGEQGLAQIVAASHANNTTEEFEAIVRDWIGKARPACATAIRSWTAYDDRASHVGRLARGLDEAAARGWTLVDMKRDWKIIYPPTP